MHRLRLFTLSQDSQLINISHTNLIFLVLARYYLWLLFLVPRLEPGRNCGCVNDHHHSNPLFDDLLEIFKCGERGTRTPSPRKEQIYSLRGYQLPVTSPKLIYSGANETRTRVFHTPNKEISHAYQF